MEGGAPEPDPGGPQRLICLVVFNSIVDGLSFFTYQMDENDNIFKAWEQLGMWGMAKPTLSLRPPDNVTT